ncbi:MAG TPA: PQQ-dependent sugar dehydrogenase [Planktothrix sp.]|jgi:glucose/arabinose dehydrogenase
MSLFERLPKRWPILVYTLCLLAAIPLVYVSCSAEPAKPDLSTLHLPPGFKIELYASIPGARSMCLSDDGTLFVGTKDSAGNVYAVDGGAGHKVHQILSGLILPNGVAYHNGSLYVGELFKVTRYDNAEKHLDDMPTGVVINDTFPHDTHHGWKYIRFGPDGKLYIPVGAPCNVCVKEDQRYASLMRMDADGKNLETYASGIRNTVGFDWNPDTKELWFTDNGRDWLGDDLPPDELNCAPKKGMNFGFPYRYGNNVKDPQFGDKAPANVEFTPPRQCLGAHVASLGVRFYNGKMFPPEYRGQVFIAEHGSWNRSVPIGYRISHVKLKDGKGVSYEPFIDGWLQNGSAWGRPVDLCVMPDGSLLISDDHHGAIYRVTYSAK